MLGALPLVSGPFCVFFWLVIAAAGPLFPRGCTKTIPSFRVFFFSSFAGRGLNFRRLKQRRERSLLSGNLIGFEGFS